MEKIESKLRRYVLSLKKHDELSAFINALNCRCEAYIFGGAARDVAFAGRQLVNDLDIIVSGSIDEEELERYSEIWKRTNFGGLRISVGQFDVDVWELTKSYAFRFDSPNYITVSNLLRTVCFSTDGIAVSLKSGRTIKTRDFEQSLAARRLDFIAPPRKIEPIIAARIARLMLKLELNLTPSVASYFVECYEEFGPSRLVEAEARWGSKRILNDIAIEQVKAEIETAIRLAHRHLSDTRITVSF